MRSESKQISLLGVALFTIYVAAPQRVQSDSIWTVPLALELVNHGTLTLDRLAPTCARVSHGCSLQNGHLRSDFPVVPVVVAAVPLALFESSIHLFEPGLRHTPLARQVERWETHAHAVGDIDLGFFDVTENILASLMCATATCVFVLALRHRLTHTRALLLGAIFGLGTPVFSTSSRVLWQSAPALLFTSVAILVLVAGRSRSLLGVVLGLSWMCRPTLALFAASILAVIIFTERKSAPPLLAGLVASVALFLIFNKLTLDVPLPPYFSGTRLDLASPTLLEAAAGNLVSPGRGLLVFTPVILLTPLSLRTLPQRAEHALEFAISIWLGTHWIAISAFPHWWGGHSFGPRLWAETMVGACWLLWPILHEPTRSRQLALGVLATFGLFVHTRGATEGATWNWNNVPENIDAAPQRVWDWSDLQFLRRR